MTNLDMLLLKGASSTTPEEGLQELRYNILTKGIPANSEGMVRSSREFYPACAAINTTDDKMLFDAEFCTID